MRAVAALNEAADNSGGSSPYALSHLDALESEAVHIFREVAGEFERPVILFSGGKDSIVMLHLALKAFAPAAIPFSLLHVDTGHNFPEVLEYRDRAVAQHSLRLHVASVQEYIDAGKLRERPDGTRNPLQTVPLTEAIQQHRFDAVFGGGRRDEEKARAKERVFSLRDEFSQWDPRRQRPELWQLYNGRHAPGEHVRVFPLSNWTELDVWQYIEREKIELPEIYFAHEREVFARNGMWLTMRRVGRPQGVGERPDAADPLPHRRRHVLHRRGRLRRHHARRRDRRDRRIPAHRAGRHPRRRQDVRGRDGRPQARRVLLTMSTTTTDQLAGISATTLLRFATMRLRRRRQVHPRRAAAARLQVGAHRPAGGRRARLPLARPGDTGPGAAHGRPAGRA